MRKPDIYLIHPVANITDEEKNFLDNYVANLESKGLKVHYPIRDVEQEDTGLNIYKNHRAAMEVVKEVHIYWDKKSSGSKCDLGMCWMARKPITLINKDQIQRTPHKSFENILLELHEDSKLV